MAARWVTLKKDESIHQPNMMDEEITSAVNRVLVVQEAPGHGLIMKTKCIARGTITAITHQNATAEMALLFRDVMIKTPRSVDKGITDVEENE